MFNTSVNTLKWRCARNWCKLNSYGSMRFIVADKCVINNKPHIVLKNIQPQSPHLSSMPFLPGLMGMMLPPGEYDEQDLAGASKN